MSRGRYLEAIFIVCLFFLFLFIPSCRATNLDHLIIVEVQIYGEESDNDFIKIYNPLDNNLNISGLKLKKRSSTGTESSARVFPKGSVISGKGYFLWANSEENYASSIGADVWSTVVLTKNNSIAILTPEGAVIDALSWGESQNPFVEGLSFPENPISNQKLERKKINNDYQDTNNNGQDFYLNPPNQHSPTQTLITTEEIKTTYPAEVIINEILPSPTGPDETDEWIEIFNKNSFEVDLSLWQITDTSGKITIYTFPEGTKISPQGFLVLGRPTTKITLNNSGDGLNLLQPDGKIIDSLAYDKAPKGQSYNRLENKWFWSESLTPGSKNIIPDSGIKEDKLSEAKKNQTELVEEKIGEKELAAVGKTTSKTFFSFLIALIIAIFSGIIILILKKTTTHPPHPPKQSLGP